MPDLRITISEASESFLREQAAEGGFASPSEFVADLIESARKEAARDRIDALLIEGLRSGPGVEATPEYWQQKKEEWTQKHQRADKP